MNNVRVLPRGGLDAETLLEVAKNANLKDCIIIGWDDKDEIYIGSTYRCVNPEVIGTIDMAKHQLLRIFSEDE